MDVNTDTRLRAIPFAIDSELREAATNHGYQREYGEADGWKFFRSDSAPCEVALGASETHWFLSVEHAGVAVELEGLRVDQPAKGFPAAFAFDTQSAMRVALSRVYQLSRSLPSAPLSAFVAETQGLGETEGDQLIRRRIGQDVFRASLIDYWNGRCPITSIEDLDLLRASHIVPWSRCATDAERLDVHNGLLLAAHWDAAFDAGLVSFDDEGAVLVSHRLSPNAQILLLGGPLPRLNLTTFHHNRLSWHREYIFQK